MKPCFGWDVAGYGGSGSGLCRAYRQGDTITATVFEATFICRPKLKMHSEIIKTAKIEMEMLRRFVEVGTAFIDVPIDLQQLPRITDYLADERAIRYWQLVKRPVDYAFNALEPLGSNLGYAVARIAHLVGALTHSQSGPLLGNSLFETYPAASLQLVREVNNWPKAAYKGGEVRFVAGQWQPLTNKRKLTTKARDKGADLAALANYLRLRAEEGCELDDDEFDAIVCAVTGCVPECSVKGDALRGVIQKRLANLHVPNAITHAVQPPAGYMLLGHFPRHLKINVRVKKLKDSDALLNAISADLAS